MADIVGIVLGAGSSRRLGRPKQTLPFGGRTLLDHVMRDVEASSLARVVLVLGDRTLGIQESLSTVRTEIAHADDAATGCAASLLAGLDSAGSCEAIVMLLGDMPGVTPDIIDQVVTAWRARSTWAAVTQYHDGLGHPFVFSSGAFDTLRGLHGDKAVWKIVDREPPSRVARIAVEHPLPRDIDTWHDYAAVHASFGFPASDRTAVISAAEQRLHE